VGLIDSEIERIRNTYSKRDISHIGKRYSWNCPDVQFTQYRIKHVISRLFVDLGWYDLKDINTLDIGCGNGSWLRNLQEWGVSASALHGIDILSDRIEAALRLSPHIDFRVASGWSLPFEDNSFNLISAHTVFSSILDSRARLELANEIVRLLKPEGMILLYDFRIRNPRNADTLGINKNEVERLFPNMPLKIKSLTLAPPIQRPLARVSPLLVHIIEALIPLLRTHCVYCLVNRND